MNQKNKPSNSYSTSPRLSRKVLYCHKATSTIEKYANRPACKDQDCQTDLVLNQLLTRDYMEALRYINECHDMMNQMYQQTRKNLRIPEVPNFIDLYMHFNGNIGNLDDIATQNLQQNISQTHCTLVDSPFEGSLNTNNYQEYSSPESDYELLAEPLKTYNKKQADIKQAKCRLNAKHVLQDAYPEEQQVYPEVKSKHLDVLYENNLNWRVSDHAKLNQQQSQSTPNEPNERHVRNKSQDMSALDFENIVEELAQHAQQKYKKNVYNNRNIQTPQEPDQRSRSVPPMKSKPSRNSSPYSRGETQECYESANEEQNRHNEARTPQTQRATFDNPCQYESSCKNSNNTNILHCQQVRQCCQEQSYDYEVPASKLLQKSHQRKAEKDCRIKQNSASNSKQLICTREMIERNSDEKIQFKKPANVQSPNSSDKLVVCKKKRSKEMVKKQYSDSDIDDEFFKEQPINRPNNNLHRRCASAIEECRTVVRPNRTELISTVKYGRKVVMRTELAPSEHPNFRQPREEQVSAQGGGESSDISSDPEFITRQ